MSQWHDCSRCGAQVGPAEGKYHECYANPQRWAEESDRETLRLMDARMSGGKRQPR